MRFRNVLAVVGTAALLTGVTAAPASAGTGASTWCGDSTRWLASVNVSDPVTVGVEIVKAPTTGHIWVNVCVSDTRAGEGGTVGGAASVEVWPGTTPSDLGFDFLVKCVPDAVFCGSATNGGVHLNLSDVNASPYWTNVCIIGDPVNCLVSVPVPGAAPNLNAHPAPLLTVAALGFYVPVNVP